LPFVAALIAGLVLGGLAGYITFRAAAPTPSPGPEPLRAHIALPDELPLATGSDVINSIELRSLTLAPDGSRLVYVAGGGKSRQLVQRRIGSFDSEPIPGTEGAFSPTFSPDGRWVPFLTPSELKKVPLDGGDPVVLCEAHVGFSTTWAEDGYVYITHHQEQLARVNENGGQLEPFAGQESVLTPHALPGGRGLLANRRSDSSVRMDDAEILHLDGEGRVTVALRGGYAPSYVPGGQLVFVRGGSLYAVDFDLDTLQATGTPVRVFDGVATDSVWGGAQYDVARSGTLVYLPRDDWARTSPTWIDRQGGLEPLGLPEQLYNTARLSRDGTKLAIHVTGASDQIQVYDFRRKTLARLTLAGGNRFPVWTKDGERVFFAGFRDGERRMYSQPLDGSTDAEPVLTAEQSGVVGRSTSFPNAVSPDGKLLLFCNVNPQTSYDLWTAPLEGGETPRPLLTSPAGEALGSFSPDGRWIVYMSDKTGRWEAYVRPFPDVERREWRVSSGGGDDPMWSPGTNELFYRDGPRVYAVRYTADPDFEPGPPELVLETDFHNSYGLSFDVAVDGQRFLVNRPVVAGQPDAPLRLIQNWTDALR
jgi:serine/threonine-protein kinase